MAAVRAERTKQLCSLCHAAIDLYAWQEGEVAEHEKPDEVIQSIRGVIKDIFLFAHLEEDSLRKLALAMFKVRANGGSALRVPAGRAGGRAGGGAAVATPWLARGRDGARRSRCCAPARAARTTDRTHHH